MLAPSHAAGEQCGKRRMLLRESSLEVEQRGEPRKKGDLVVSITGRDKAGESLTQDALASSLSASGALLSGITRQMRSGDLIWIEYGGRKARFKIIWVRNLGL